MTNTLKENKKNLKGLKAYKNLLENGWTLTSEKKEKLDGKISLYLGHPNTKDIVIKIEYIGEL